MAKHKLFIVVDIGCIECGAESSILGVYKTREEATATHKMGDYFNHEQHSVQVFEKDVEL